MLRKVHQIYGATGATFAKAMSEGQGTFNTAVWSNQHVRNAAQEAATQAASHAAQVNFKGVPGNFKHFRKKILFQNAFK